MSGNANPVSQIGLEERQSQQFGSGLVIRKIHAMQRREAVQGSAVSVKKMGAPEKKTVSTEEK